MKLPDRVFTEEERSKMPTVFTVLRAVTDLFHSAEDASLGLYGAFGYDLAFQFDAIDLKLKRPDDQRDMVLFLPDEILVVDHYAAKAWIAGGLSKSSDKLTDFYLDLARQAGPIVEVAAAKDVVVVIQEGVTLEIKPTAGSKF